MRYLLIHDYSKWLEIIKIRGKTASEIIYQFKKVFLTHGIPEELVTDNMPLYSCEFRSFAKEWNFKLTTSSPNYPKSNGQAEKRVHIAKRMLQKCNKKKELTSMCNC